MNDKVFCFKCETFHIIKEKCPKNDPAYMKFMEKFRKQ